MEATGRETINAILSRFCSEQVFDEWPASARYLLLVFHVKK